MRRVTLTLSLAVALALATGFARPTEAYAADPTCSTTLGITVHGQHIVGDYLTGIGHENLDWPPSGGIVGETIRANGGIQVAGGPGPGFHFPNGFAPGASFCVESSQGINGTLHQQVP